jgi:hypothetical protein
MGPSRRKFRVRRPESLYHTGWQLLLTREKALATTSGEFGQPILTGFKRDFECKGMDSVRLEERQGDLGVRP